MNMEQYTPQCTEILKSIQDAKRNAYKQVNSVLIELYWNTGQNISKKLESSDWGEDIVENLSLFIRENDTEIKAFSANNLWRIKKFHETYKNLPQSGKNLPEQFLNVSWSHHRRIMTLKSAEEREFYLQLCSRQNYSIRELEKLIKSGTFERTVIADENPSETVRGLPQKTENIFKDSYMLDSINLPKAYKEKDLHTALTLSLKDFILEFGVGFSFIAQEYRLQIGNDDSYIDLLFFHRELQCLIAFELKTTKLKPQYTGTTGIPPGSPGPGCQTAPGKPEYRGAALPGRRQRGGRIRIETFSEYETKLMPKKTLRKKLNELYELLEGSDKDKA